jgi:hypothetical protein
MIQYRRLAIGAASLALVLGGAAALAQPSVAEGGNGRMEGMQGMHEKMQAMHGQMADRHGDGAGHEAMGQLMTPQEREAMREKMKAAKTPEERQALAAGMRTEIEKRAKEKGITLPERHARMGGMGGMGSMGAMAGMSGMGMRHDGAGPDGGEHKH